MDKKSLQVVPGTESGPEASSLDPFAPENLRLDPSTTEGAGVKKLLTTIPVKKPGRQTFFRVHPEYREMFPIIDLKDDREEYIVVKELVSELAAEIVHKQLCLAITRQGSLFFLPLRLPGADGKDMGWWKSLRECAKVAETRWIRVLPNHEIGAYECFQGDEALSEPVWPSPNEYPFWGLIRIAFRDYLITDLDHPVVKRLRGLA